MARERLLVNFFYAQPVGHAVEALYYCHGHHLADPGREIAVALNAATATDLAALCPFVTSAYAIDHPFVGACADSGARLARAELPRDWDWVLDDFRRHQQIQLGLFPGMRDYYAASDAHLAAARGRSVVSAREAGYVGRQQLRFELPEAARAAARDRLAGDGGDPDGPWIAVMPGGGSGDPSLYPSVASWLLILDAIAERIPGVRLVLVGKLRRDERTATALDATDLARLRAHRTRPVDAFDLPLVEQLALVEACGAFCSPHTGFGMAALAVATPWLTISGGRWFEYFFNRVPFRSIVPDTERYPAFSQFHPVAIADDREEGPRTPSMSRARIRDDLDAITSAAAELLAGSLTYEDSLRDYFAALVSAHQGETHALWSIDGVHLDYV